MGFFCSGLRRSLVFFPRPPPPIIWACAGIALAALGNQPPLVSLLGFTISLGGLNQAARFLGITLVSLIGELVRSRTGEPGKDAL